MECDEIGESRADLDLKHVRRGPPIILGGGGKLPKRQMQQRGHLETTLGTSFLKWCGASPNNTSKIVSVSLAYGAKGLVLDSEMQGCWGLMEYLLYSSDE